MQIIGDLAGDTLLSKASILPEKQNRKKNREKGIEWWLDWWIATFGFKSVFQQVILGSFHSTWLVPHYPS